MDVGRSLLHISLALRRFDGQLMASHNYLLLLLIALITDHLPVKHTHFFFLRLFDFGSVRAAERQHSITVNNEDQAVEMASKAKAAK